MYSIISVLLCVSAEDSLHCCLNLDTGITHMGHMGNICPDAWWDCASVGSPQPVILKGKVLNLAAVDA